jgi:hypothetical protein
MRTSGKRLLTYADVEVGVCFIFAHDYNAPSICVKNSRNEYSVISHDIKVWRLDKVKVGYVVPSAVIRRVVWEKSIWRVLE